MNKSNKILDTLVIATKNSGKVEEMSFLLYDVAKQLLTYKDVFLESPDETGISFEENAMIKAVCAAETTGYPAISDDTGLCIDELDGMPGIYTARWAGNGKSYVLGIEKIKQKLNNRTSKAMYVSCLAFCLPGGKHYVFRGELTGKVAFPSEGEVIGYESIFIPDGFNKSLSTLSADIRLQIHHRTKSVEKLKDFIKSIDFL